jgi:hypothetical protein
MSPKYFDVLVDVYSWLQHYVPLDLCHTSYMDEQTVELRSTTGEKLVVTILFLFMGCYAGGGFMLAPFFPHLVNASPEIAQANLEGKLSIFSGGLLLFLFFYYWWWRTLTYRLYADAIGLRVHKVFHQHCINWYDVASYSSRITNDHYKVVLWDAKGRVLFRSPWHDFAITPRATGYRAQFWEYVTDRLVNAQHLL